MAEGTDERPEVTRKAHARAVILVVVVLVALVALIVVKIATQPGDASVGGQGASDASGAGAQADAGSLTTTHNDAVADYQAALKTGKPIYLLFHSLTCASCVEISATADRVVPAYADKVVFVNAITDDPSGQQLASRFAFQYIPTSFFLRPDGTVVDSFTGVLTDAAMKARLDSLAAQ